MKKQEESKLDIEEELKKPEYPKPAEICKICGTVLLLKTGPEEYMFENTKAGKTKAAPDMCRKCYDKEVKKWQNSI